MKRIALVLGAGASLEYGFPLGSGLNEIIREDLHASFGSGRPSGDIVDTLRERGGLSPDHIQAAKRLRDGLLAHASIDRLLHSRRDDECLVFLGKLAIARALLMAERNSPLSRLNLNDRDKSYPVLSQHSMSWAHQFFTLVTRGRSPHDIEGAFDAVTIVTFNYDRVIERYLINYLQHVHDQDPGRARVQLEKLNIIHVYGSLGQLPEIHGGDAAFGACDTHRLSAAAGRIRTFMEGAEEGTLDKAQRALADAETVVFLGFGFDPQNVSALAPKSLSDATTVYGTFFGSDVRRQELGELFPRMSFERQDCKNYMQALIDSGCL